jgi:hypothetical protein
MGAMIPVGNATAGLLVQSAPNAPGLAEILS